jgi:hypothetical protein
MIGVGEPKSLDDLMLIVFFFEAQVNPHLKI